MKHLVIFLSLATLGICFATVRALTQDGSKPRLDAAPVRPQTTTALVELPRTHLNKNRLHKLMITDQDLDVYNELARAGAIRNEVDYGSYKLIVVDEEAAGGRAVLESMPVAPRDDQNMMVFNGYLIDTSEPQPLSRELPARLKQSRMSAALAGEARPERGIYIVQFIGPIQDSWRKGVEKTGAEVVTYAPYNAYVVLADERAAGELVKMKESSPFVQWLGDFQPAYKLTPYLRRLIESGDSQPLRVTIQLIDSPEGNLLAGQLRASSPQHFNERRVSRYRNLTMIIPASQLVTLAQHDAVMAMEEDRQPVRLDEVQGQIVAGNLTGNLPSGPGYLSWLASKGFDSSQFGSFAINVVDDAYSLRGHPDLPDSRIAFEHNPTNQSGPQGGHGFINSHIIGGFNDGASSAYEDAGGFNYGLGIAPWARVGVTAIFGDFSLTNPTSWEDAAYSQDARISSNSWGFNFTYHYDIYSQEYDYLVRDAQSTVAGNQQLTVVFAAANDGVAGGNTVTSPATAKNVITVGASENVRPGNTDGCRTDSFGADSANDIASFSSRGPVNPDGGDGRVKPDLVAPGTHVEGGVPQSNYDGSSVCDQYFPPGQTLYGWSSGTSHSTPAVAGGAALVYQDFLNKGLEAPSPAMIKAVLMNSASYLTGTGAGDTLPSNNQGMGLMNLGRAFDGAPRLLTDQTRVLGSTGETYRVFGSVASTDRPVRITLAWSDAPGTPVGAPWVNDLDLEVTINGQTYRGNVFSGAVSTTGGFPDGQNNVESVFLPTGMSGTFLVTVRATNIAGDGVPGNGDSTDQDFALVVHNANAATSDSPIIDLRPTRLSFTAVAGGNNPASQSFYIGNAGPGPLDWTASDDASWLTVSPANGPAPSMAAAAVDISGLADGTYNASISIASANAFNSPAAIPVTLTVIRVFEVDPSSLSFQASDSNPPSQTISITNNDSTPRAWTASSDAPWLIVSPESGTAPASLSVSVAINGLAAATHRGMITIRPVHAPAAVIRVPVSLTVTGPLRFIPSSLNFEGTFGRTKLPSQTLQILTPPRSQSQLGWTASENTPWLTISQTSGTTPARLQVSVDISGLAVGNYTGTIMVRPVGALDIPALIPVAMTISPLSNGGFEPLPDQWILSGLAMGSQGPSRHSGTGYLLMGGSNRAEGTAYQQIMLAPGSSPKLSFWLNVTSDETTTTEQRDRFFIEIRDTRGRLLQTLATFSNLNRSAPGSYALAGDYSLAGFAGRTVRIQFRTTNDSATLTTFRIDDVSVK
jgi:hypothetical protein